MQQAISRRDVYRPSLTATISGQQVDLESASMSRAMPDPLQSGGLTAASGTLVAVEGDDVAREVVTPWDEGTDWPPRPEAPVTMDFDMGSGPVSMIRNGRVVATEGGMGRTVTIDVVDAYQTLDRTISWDALADIMPSPQEGVLPRYVGLTSTHITNTILRHCGWYTTPPLTNYVMLSVPAQGSMWPERGWVETSNRMDSGGYPYWLLSDWGIAAADVDATYTLQGGGYTLAGRGGVELSAMTQTSSPASPGTMYLDVHAGEGRLRLSWTDSDVFLRFRNPGGAYTTAATVPRTNGLAYASVRYVSATSLEVTLRSGAQSVTQTVTVASGLTSSPMLTARIWGQGRGGGYMVAAPDVQGRLVGWTPNAVLYPRLADRNALRVWPAQEGVNCADLLASQCEAECATYWIDETGILRWWDLARLESRPPVAELTSDDDITDEGFTWSHSLSSVKSRVSVKWREPLASMSWRTSIDLWQGNGATLQPGDVLEDWLEVPDDEVWIMPDLTLGRVGDNFADYNNGLGSWYGAVITGTGDDADQWAQLHGSLLMTITRVTDRAFKTWVQWTGSKQCVQRTPSERLSSSLWLSRRNLDLPIIRGKAKWTLTDRLTYSSMEGPATAPEHTIDAGWWIQSEAQAQYTADYAASRLTVPQPVLSSIALVPIPGLQIGDMVTVTDTHVTHLTIQGIVQQDSKTVDSGMDVAHAVAVRPVLVSPNRVTWQRWGRTMDGRTRETWGGEQQPKTWEQWGSDPLAGEET